MSYSVLNLKQELTGIIHGTSLNQVVALDELIYRAGRKLLLDIDPQETKRITSFINPVYNGIYDYVIPVDIKGNKIIDIFPQANRQITDRMTQLYNKDFDIIKQKSVGQSFSILFNSGIKTIRIDDPSLTPPIKINNADSITGNGTWSVGGDASNLLVNSINFVSTPSSLNFTLANGGTSGYIENSTMAAQDLTIAYNQGKNFLWVYLPIASYFSSINLKWGSSNANYYEKSVTSDFFGNAFVNGWNLLGFDWFTSIITGVPDYTAIKYIKVEYNYAGTTPDMTGVGLNSITARIGEIMNVEYYSKYLFKDVSTGAWQESITDDSNIINLDIEGIQPLLSQVSIYTAQQVQGYSATQFDYAFWEKKYNEEVTRYKALYKSEVQKPQSTYYSMPNNSYNKWANQRFIR